MNKRSDTMPPVMILCGGKGTRLREVTELLPKPMVPIGDFPIVWHIMKCFAAFGVRRFILCLGYKSEAFVDFFLNYHLRTGDATITLGHRPDITFYGENSESDWQVTLARTGEDAMTGTRIARAAKYLAPDDDYFFLTYGDGVADVDVARLLDAHVKGGKLLTVSAVHPEARFGEMKIAEDGTVLGFEEKPAQGDGYVNGGFMAVSRAFIPRYLDGAGDVFFEREPMSGAARDGEMRVCRHEGFWQCMDNPREYALLNAMWRAGHAPWTKYWK